MQVRELSLDDFPAVKALNERHGLRTPAYEEWARLWADNPFADQFGDVPPGWVMQDAQGRIVGSFCNVPVMYDFGGRPIRSATAMAWAVDEEHRPSSMLLVGEYFAQKNVDLLLNTTANPVAGQIFEAFKAERLPLESYDRNLLWITRYQPFARAATQKLGWKGAGLLQMPVAGCLASQDLWRWMRSSSNAQLVSQTPSSANTLAAELADGFDARFDQFWQQLKTGDTRLRAVRDAQSLDWHFGCALRREDAFVVTLPAADGSGDTLDGYLVAVRRDREDIGLRRYQVADLQTGPGRAELVKSLVCKALEVAREEGAAVVELTGFESAKHQVAQSLPHRIRRLPNWPFFFKARDPQLSAELRNPDVWDPSPFDGDATL